MDDAAAAAAARHATPPAERGVTAIAAPVYTPAAPVPVAAINPLLQGRPPSHAVSGAKARSCVSRAALLRSGDGQRRATDGGVGVAGGKEATVAVAGHFPLVGYLPLAGHVPPARDGDVPPAGNGDVPPAGYALAAAPKRAGGVTLRRRPDPAAGSLRTRHSTEIGERITLSVSAHTYRRRLLCSSIHRRSRAWSQSQHLQEGKCSHRHADEEEEGEEGYSGGRVLVLKNPLAW